MKQFIKGKIARIKAKIKRFNAEPNIFKRMLWYLSLLAVCIFSSVAVLILLILMGVFGEVPSKKELSTINHQVATEVFSADSVLLGRYYFQERSTVPASSITPALKNALVATEDVRFYKHHGIDIRSLFRVLIKSIILQNESASLRGVMIEPSFIHLVF